MQQLAPRSTIIDRELVDDRVHGKRQTCLHSSLGRDQGIEEPCLRFALNRWIEEESHAATRHSAEHQESPKLSAPFLAALFDHRFSETIGTPRNNGLEWSGEILGRQLRNTSNLSLLK